ncbi:MAG: hypothetical protein HYU37_05570 [Acidobacteria bacterium]|nr:hypothetical protein [Acidobacteriota bacterium]
MMVQLAAVVLCLALPVGALYAPLVHAHFDGHHQDHHQPGAVHAHFGGHAAAHHPSHSRERGGSAVERGVPGARTVRAGVTDEPEQTTRLQIFVAVEAGAFTPPSLPPARFTLAPVPASIMRQPPHEVRSHGPPAARLLSPRAPPLPAV